MKKKQRTVSKFIHLSVMVLCLSIEPLYGQDSHLVLIDADSLFMQKQYTQSFKLYKDLFDRKKYSEAMLLKTAFIQEGLGNITQSLYYLNLYYLVVGDPKASQKMEKIANKNHLMGYTPDVLTQVRYTLYRHYTMLSLLLLIVTAALFGGLVYQRKKLSNIPYGLGLSLILLLILFFLHANFSQAINQGITTSSFTHLMDGPASGASVKDIIGAGNRVDITGQKDVWLRVKWMNRQGYIRKNQILPIEL